MLGDQLKSLEMQEAVEEAETAIEGVSSSRELNELFDDLRKIQKQISEEAKEKSGRWRDAKVEAAGRDFVMEVEGIVNRALEILQDFDMPKADAMKLFKTAEKSFKEVVGKSRSDVKPPNEEERAADVKLFLKADLKERENKKERLEDAISTKKEALEVIEENLKTYGWQRRFPLLNKRVQQLETEKAEVSKLLEDLQAQLTKWQLEFDAFIEVSKVWQDAGEGLKQFGSVSPQQALILKWMAGHIQNDLKLARGMGHYADDGFARLQRQTQSLLQEMRAAKTLKDFDKGLGRFLSDFQADEDFSAKTNAFSVVLNLHRLLNPGCEPAPSDNTEWRNLRIKSVSGNTYDLVVREDDHIGHVKRQLTKRTWTSVELLQPGEAELLEDSSLVEALGPEPYVQMVLTQSHLVIASVNRSLILWDYHRADVEELHSIDSTITALRADGATRRVLLGCSNGNVQMIRETGEKLVFRKVRGYVQSIEALWGQDLAVVAHGSELSVYSLQQREPQRVIPQPEQVMQIALGWAPGCSNSPCVVSACLDWGPVLSSLDGNVWNNQRRSSNTERAEMMGRGMALDVDWESQRILSGTTRGALEL
ncbi:unnamed protein product [Durusdinium trenchii]|uniref:Uncharacterized protein n=1 Tax=Durusdinium trenchii TaxID=1381693 RepID=A0ABP0HCM1_9DINO